MDNKRRNFVKTGIVLGTTSSLSGCALLDFFRRHEDSIRPVLCSNGSIPVVDSHAHFFNGTDLLAGQYLTGPVAGDLVNYYNIGLIRVFMRLAGRAVQRLATTLALSASGELDYLKTQQSELLQLNQANSFSYLEHGYKKTSEAFYEALTDAERKELQSAINEYETLRNNILQHSMGSEALRNVGSSTLDRDFLFNAIVGQTSEENIESISDIKLSALNFLRLDVLAAFVLRVLSKRSSNLAEYQSIYSSSASGPLVLNATDVTVDFDYWLGGCEGDYVSNHSSQVALHEKINEISQGYTIPILGVNPMKLVSQGNSYLDFIERTLQRGVYRGVKIYPANGYSPNGDLHSELPDYISLCGNTDFPDAVSIQKALYDIYAICIQNNAVVMAHSDKSKGYPKSAASLGGPSYWKAVFEADGLHDLKVNFGHLGEFKSSKTSNWTSEFLELMKAGNRYGDLGFWFTRDSKSLSSRLFRELKLIDDDLLYNRILYGTDWFMLTSKPSWKPYLDRANRYFDELIEEGAFSSKHKGQEAKNMFFYQNAQKLFGNSVSAC